LRNLCGFRFAPARTFQIASIIAENRIKADIRRPAKSRTYNWWHERVSCEAVHGRAPQLELIKLPQADPV
jgi:hypothetical protein